MAFVTAGYPTRDATVPILLAMEAGGADVIELGMPFTDPQADGPAIQEANNVSASFVCGQHIYMVLSSTIILRYSGRHPEWRQLRRYTGHCPRCSPTRPESPHSAHGCVHPTFPLCQPTPNVRLYQVTIIPC